MRERVGRGARGAGRLYAHPQAAQTLGPGQGVLHGARTPRLLRVQDDGGDTGLGLDAETAGLPLQLPLQQGAHIARQIGILRHVPVCRSGAGVLKKQHGQREWCPPRTARHRMIAMDIYRQARPTPKCQCFPESDHSRKRRRAVNAKKRLVRPWPGVLYLSGGRCEVWRGPGLGGGINYPSAAHICLAGA